MLTSGTSFAQTNLETLLPSVSDPQKTSLAELSGKKVIWVLLDRMPLELLSESTPPNLQKIWGQGSAALLNCQTDGGVNSKNAYLTLGSGIKLKASEQAALAYQYDELLENGNLARDEYYWLTGQKPPVGSLFNLQINRLYNLNRSSNHDLVIGSLGEALHQANLKTAVLGNANYSSADLQKAGVLVAMDSQGLVDQGQLGQETLLKDESFASGFRTNYQQLFNYYQELDTALTVLDLGDFNRIYQNWDNLSPERIAHMNQTALQELDLFLGLLLTSLAPEDLLVLTVPSPGYQLDPESYENPQADKLTWTAFYNVNLEPGFLYSSTTRRDGLVDNTDLAPTLLNWLEYEVPLELSGRILNNVGYSGNSLTALSSMAEQITLNNSIRPIITKTYVYLQTLFLILAGLFLWRKFKGGQYLKPYLFLIPLFPLALLLLPLWQGQSFAAAALALVISLVILTALFSCLQRKTGKGWLVLGLLTAGLVLGDALFGSNLQKTSLFSYDPIIGARFYGIGNEYMGVCIGALILGTVTLYSQPYFRQDQLRQRLFLGAAGLVYFIAVWIMAFPSLGTNVGGSIACIAAYLVTILLLSGRKISWKIILGVALAVMVGVGSFIAYDLSRPATLQSHMGQAASAIMTGGWNEIQDIINRKLGTNLRLLKDSVWGRVFVLDLLLLIFLYNQQHSNPALKTKFKQWRKQNPILVQGLISTLVGAVVAAGFNDSGILSAVICTSYAVFPLLYALIEELYPTKSSL